MVDYGNGWMGGGMWAWTVVVLFVVGLLVVGITKFLGFAEELAKFGAHKLFVAEEQAVPGSGQRLIVALDQPAPQNDALPPITCKSH